MSDETNGNGNGDPPNPGVPPKPGDPPKEKPPILEPSPQYIGLNNARSAAVTVGWLRADSAVLLQAPLIAVIVLLMWYDKREPFELLPLKIIVCLGGMFVSYISFLIIRRSRDWVTYHNRKLADIELANPDLKVRFYSDPDFERLSKQLGTGKL